MVRIVPAEKMDGEEILTDQVGGVEFAVGQCLVDIAASPGTRLVPQPALNLLRWPQTPFALAGRPPAPANHSIFVDCTFETSCELRQAFSVM